MTEPTTRCPARCSSPAVYCGNCDLLVGLDGLEVAAVDERLRVRVESPPGPMGCPNLRRRCPQPTAGVKLS